VDLAEKEQKLKEISAEIEKCERCPLHLTRNKSVPGEGPANAEIMFIGEAPGYHENEEGRPFVGAAGNFLNELLESIGMDRSKVFITNIVKSRPPGNRDPQPDELAACAPWLNMQIETINPLMIITLGRFSMAHFQPKAKISEIHGKAAWIDGRLIVSMYHPAAALHQPALKSTLEKDFAKIPAYVEQARAAQAGKKKDGTEPPPKKSGSDHPTQMSLF
jgi:uracil-DNA glycosylase